MVFFFAEFLKLINAELILRKEFVLNNGKLFIQLEAAGMLKLIRISGINQGWNSGLELRIEIFTALEF